MRSLLYYGSKLHDVLRAFGMATAIPGQPFYVSDESEDKTYAATIDNKGDISDLRLFEEKGEESVTVDEKGNVYLAARQVFVYHSSGHLIDTIEVPERPSQLLFGGSNGKTLFILARSSLYTVQTRYKGR
jgi:sugar lactone lactonase YvrE